MPDDPKDREPPPTAAADKPAGTTPGEPLKAEVSRTDAPGAGASAAPVAPAAATAAPKPANPTAAQTATTSETSSATGQPTAPAEATRPVGAEAVKPAAPAAKAPAAPAAAKPAAPHAPPPPAPPSGPTDPPPPAGTAVPAFIATLQNAVSGSVDAISYYLGDWTVIVPAAQLPAAGPHLQSASDALFDFCSDVTATDWPPRKDARFDVIYCLYSTRLRQRVRLKVKVGDQQP